VITSVLAESTLAERGIVTGKIFEAVGLGTRVLLIAPPGNDAAPIVENNAMGRRVTGTDIEGITQFLLQEGCQRSNSRKPSASYSWPALATRLDSIFRSVSGAKQDTLQHSAIDWPASAVPLNEVF
jgi:hypothetical protein